MLLGLLNAALVPDGTTHAINTTSLDASLDGQIIIPDQHTQGNRVIILPANTSTWSESDILWEWTVAVKNWGKHMSDARRVSYKGEDHILLCGSSGGIALVTVESKKLVYWNTPSKMTPHAVALLPDDLIAVADPADSGGGTSSVHVFDMRKGANAPPVQTLDQGGCHGIVWDSERSSVWAWGGSALHQYAYASRKLANKASTFKPPSSWDAGGGHAITPMGSSQLLFAYNGGLGTFDIKTKAFAHYSTTVPHSIKGVSYNPTTDEVIYCHEDEATGDSRSHYVHSVQQKKDRSLADGKWYKAHFYFYNHL